MASTTAFNRGAEATSSTGLDGTWLTFLSRGSPGGTEICFPSPNALGVIPLINCADALEC